MNTFTFSPSSSSKYTLNNFEGPLDLLLYLVQKEELGICDIFLQEVTGQFVQKLEKLEEVDEGAEFLALSTTLLLMKSRKLLPNAADQDEDGTPLRAEMLHALLEYCRFKEMARELSDLQEQQSVHFQREPLLEPTAKRPGLEDVELQELTEILQQVVKRAAAAPPPFRGEEVEWRLEPKIAWLQEEIGRKGSVEFADIFHPSKSRPELIVLFLALLELMKVQKVHVTKTEENTFTLSKP